MSALRAQRWMRLLGVLLAVVVVGFLGYRGVDRLRLGPDLAAGKPWRASSAYAGFSAEAHTCDGNDTKILFHTNEEQNPWYEVDLGSSRKIKAVEIRNRSDGFAERAVPLAVEVSEDKVGWQEVAQRPTAFDTWRATFTPRNARYVRVKSLKRTWLHLERVGVYLPGSDLYGS